MSLTSLERITGALIGTALGDALGAPYEFKRRGTFTVDTSQYHRGVFGTDPGASTDDSELSWRLGKSLVGKQGWDQKDYARRLIAWKESGPPDIGSQTSSAIAAWKWEHRAPRESTAGNGSLMAIAPIILAYAWTGVDSVTELALAFSDTTHPNPDVRAAVKRHVQMFMFAMELGSLPRRPPGGHAPRMLAPFTCEEMADGSSQGWAPLTQSLSEWALRYSVQGASPFQELVKIISLGGDTDSNAAVAGALLGARYGVGMFPTNLVAKLDRLGSWLKLADDLDRLSGKLADCL